MEKSIPARFFTRMIYRVYSRNSALAHFFTYRFRPAGVLLTLLIPASWILLPQHDSGPLFQIRGMIIILLSFSFAWALSRRARVKVTRQLPRLATANEPLQYQVRIQNMSRRRLSGASLIEMAPDNRPTLRQFHGSREPGEEDRNIFDRIFCYYRWEWLQRTLTIYSPQVSLPLSSLAPKQSTETNLTLTPSKRGIITLNDLRLCLPDPFGIFQRCQKTKNPQNQLIVLPHRYRLPPLNLPGSARFQLGGESASGTIGQSGDFTSVRDYRPGDPLKHIHWKSWARTGKPIVKEYEDLFFPRYGLVLDTFSPAEDADLFEEAVSVAASFAATIDTRDTLLDLMFIRDEAYIFTAGRGEERIDKMLEVLAGVQCEPRSDYTSLENLILRYRDELTACICIFVGWSEQHANTITRLQRSGVSIKLMVVCRDLDSTMQLHSQHPSTVAVHWLRAGHLQNDLMQP